MKVPAFVLMCLADGIEIGLFKCLCPDYSMSKGRPFGFTGELAPGFGWLFIPDALEQTERVVGEGRGPLRRWERTR